MNPIRDRVDTLARRVNAWSESRLSRMHPDDREELLEFDRGLSRDFSRWIGAAIAAAVLGVLLLKALWPTQPWGHALLDVTAFGLGFSFIVMIVWFNYRGLAAQSWKLAATIVAMVVPIALVTVGAVGIESGRPFSDWPVDRMVRAIAVALAIGLAAAGLIFVIPRVRLREAAERSARLAAENERERFARQTAQAELKLIQAQVEPHFLFNTLANVRHLVQAGSADALPMLDHLIHYLRTALPEVRRDSTTLGREAELARAYLEIMRMRIGELSFAIDVPAGLAAHEFPPLMLMTLVENAVKHGVAPAGHGEIRIAARQADGRIEVDVIDDGRGLGGGIGQGVGLSNVRDRLKALYGDDARLSLESGASGGTCARLEIPS